MIFALGLPLFVLAALVQAAAMPYFSPLGATPNVILILTGVWIALGGHRQAMLLLPFSALLYDLISANATGSSLIALAPLLLLTNRQDQDPTTAHLTPALFIVGIGTIVYHLIDGLIVSLLGDEMPWFSAIVHSWLPETLVNAVLTPLVFLPLWQIGLTIYRRNASISWNT